MYEAEQCRADRCAYPQLSKAGESGFATQRTTAHQCVGGGAGECRSLLYPRTLHQEPSALCAPHVGSSPSGVDDGA